MLIHDDTYQWDGWGGVLRLGSGQCRLRIYDLRKDDGEERLTHLRPIVVVVSDIPESRMSVRSCASHIATRVIKDFDIDRSRMVWIEYYPGRTYGIEKQRNITESYDMVEFQWFGNKAMHPRWRDVNQPLLDTIRSLLANSP